MDALAITLGTHIRQFFGFARIHRNIVFAGVLTHDHSFIDGFAGFNHQAAALLNHVQRVGHGFAAFHADERPVFAGDNFAAVSAVFMEEMTHDTEASGLIDQIGLKSD
ncbi:hypothetical protein SDC9_176924 [bioreactor metagenome]|uniref:Uncharacterized protein n=1 Tax=bioreactor metagenome TaxID=1076179 RepID=A0A645GRI4_9ZZZZ